MGKLYSNSTDGQLNVLKAGFLRCERTISRCPLVKSTVDTLAN